MSVPPASPPRPAPRPRLRRLPAVAAWLAAAVLAACAAPAPPPPAIDTVGRALAPYEAIGWPRPLSRLGLPEGRDYVALLHVAPLRPIDLSSEERARVTLEAAVFDPLAIAAGKTAIGHLIVAWQCGGVRGIASQTGESSGQGLRMATAGWGVAAVLSTFTDGRVLPARATSWRHLTVLDAGRGNILVAEVDAAGCARLRSRLAGFLTHPSAPASRFGLLPDPARFEGAGCLSFALWLAGEAGVLSGRREAFRRTLAVRDSIVGRRDRVLPTTLPYAPAGLGEGERIVTLAQLRRGPWTAGRILERVRLVDGELIFAAVTSLRAGAGARPGWREARALPASDPGVAAALAAARAWAAAYPVWRVADPEGVSALVLERR